VNHEAPMADPPPITVSMTTISLRLDSVAATLRSLLAQDYPSLTLRLYLSRAPFLLDNGVPGRLPEKLAELDAEEDRLSIRFVPNIGPYRKILPFLNETRGKRCLVATADDDTLYPPGWLSGLYSAYRRHRCVVCYRGHFMRREDRQFLGYRRWMSNGPTRNPDLYNLPTGKDGVLYDTSFFDPAVLNYIQALNIAPTADDLWLKWHYSALEDVPTFIINPNYSKQTFEDQVFGESLYRNFNRDGGNDAAVARLEAYAEKATGRRLAARL